MLVRSSVAWFGALGALWWWCAVDAGCVDHALAASGPVAVVRAVDGDTVALRVVPPLPAPLGEVHLRIRGVDCPELFKPGCAGERAAAGEALRFTQEWLPRAAVLRLCGWDKYGGRVLGDLGAVGGGWLSERLLASAHARVYDGRGPRASWCTCPAAPPA
jgi:endonuclease YncB( thermonuclease family)